jgi:hypothetical protein
MDYNESMLHTIYESVAKIKYTVRIKLSVCASHAIMESIEGMCSTQNEHHNKQIVPVSLCTIQAQ